MFHPISFLFTGIFQTLGAQWLHYQGSATSTNGFTLSANYLGMALVLLLPAAKDHTTAFPFRTVLLITITDLTAQACATVGLFMIGSGLFQVIYASIVLFTALLSKWLLNRHLHWLQWLGMLTLTIGLSLSTLDQPRNQKVSWTESGQVMGWIWTLLGTALFATVYVLNEKALQLQGIQESRPEQLCARVGTMAFLGLCIYEFIFIIPHLETSILSSPDLLPVLICYLFLVLSSFLHSLNYFHLLRNMGAVSTGVLQALRAVSVFGASALLFCERDAMQCFQWAKLYATLVVGVGVLIYAKGTAQSKHEKSVKRRKPSVV